MGSRTELMLVGRIGFEILAFGSFSKFELRERIS